MTLTSTLLGFAGIAFLITIIPATDTALVLRSLTAQGPRAAFACVFGISSGLLIWGIAAATGLAVLMAAIPGVFELITLAGGLYLLYLGTRFLLNLRRWGSVSALKNDDAALAAQPQPQLPEGVKKPGVHQAFLSGFIANILNPKIAVFYIATVPPFLVDSVPPLMMGTYLALIHGIINILWFAAIIWLAKFTMRWLLHPRASLVIDAVTGTVLVIFGITIALEALPKLLA